MNEQQQVKKIKQKYFNLVESAIDIATKNDNKITNAEFTRKVQASKLGMTAVKDHEINERVNRALDLREKADVWKMSNLQKKIRTNKKTSKRV